MGYSDITPADPVAGAGFTILTSTNNAQKLVALTFTFITDSTAINRAVLFTYTTPLVTTAYEVDVPFFQIASKSWIYSCAINGPRSMEISVNLHALVNLPDLPLPPGSSIAISSATIASGDQFTAIGYLLQDVSKFNT